MTKLRMMLMVIFVFVGLVVYTTVHADQHKKEAPTSNVRVGTFDSRGIALAYYRSKAFQSYVKNLKAEHTKAEAAGDKERVKELVAEGEDGQTLAHKQGFGTWPVDNILENVKGKIPEIAEQVGVDLIVSKWDVVYQRSGIECVDVTEAMMMLLNPDKQTLDILEELRNQAPVPLEELEKHEH